MIQFRLLSNILLIFLICAPLVTEALMKKTGTMKKDRFRELKMYSDEVSKLKDHAKFAIVAANNHYAGFGPATANRLER